MDLVLAVGVRQLLGGLVFDFREDEGGKRGSLGGGGSGAFCENGGFVRNAGAGRVVLVFA